MEKLQHIGSGSGLSEEIKWVVSEGHRQIEPIC